MKRKISVFIASPGDLVAERNIFRQTIERLNAGFGDGCNVEFEALGWEDTLASTGRRNQGLINRNIDQCDVFILAMYRRWGQEAPDSPYSSYTEEEFHRALELWKKEQKPEIFVFFKRIDPASEADPGPQLEKVLKFKRQLEDSRQVMHRTFADETAFADEIDTHLRAFTRGDIPVVDAAISIVLLPLDALAEVEKAKALVSQKIREAKDAHDEKYEAHLKIEALQLQSAEDAAALSLEGKIEFARQRFAQLVAETSNIRILDLAHEFYTRTGDIDTAFYVIEKWLNISGVNEISENTAVAYVKLGALYDNSGEFDKAHDMYTKALEINEVLGCKRGMASVYGNLGILYATIGERDKAHDMYTKALEINEALDNRKGMAANYGNLGILYQNRGKLDEAHIMYSKALEIEQAFGRKDGVAIQYGNMGNLHLSRGEFDKAYDMYTKSLEIDTSIDRKEGIAANYGNLGILHLNLGELDEAHDMFVKALEIEKAMARKEGMATQYGNLGNLYLTLAEHDKGLDMLLKALDINQTIGRKEGVAIQYTNLGILYANLGELDKARSMCAKAFALFVDLESPHAEKLTAMLNDLESKGFGLPSTKDH